MNESNPDRNEDHNAHLRSLTELEQTNRELSQQVAHCRQQLSQAQQTLTEAQWAVAQDRELETQRNKLRVAERELTELKTNFILLASHEFRTPMMTILTSASLIGRLNGELDGDHRERHVQRIKVAVGDLTIMLNEFLAISQFDHNAQANQPVTVDLAPFISAIFKEIEQQATLRQRFHYEAIGGVSSCQIDEHILKNILLHLLSNASKYSAENTDIYLTSAIDPEGLTLTIRDQGIGIPDSDQANLFVNFFRARNAVHIQGAGLGLYLAKRYVDLLGGTITFTSQVGEGTVFQVQLPLTS